MKRTSIQLADGRELIYFDERDDAVRAELDRRDLPPTPPASELRYDPLVDEWVAIATHRQTRTFLPPSDECPLCPSTPERSTEIPAYDYDVVVFENRFPSFNHRRPSEPLTAPTPLSPVRPGTGRCEVVCFTPDHTASFASLSPERVRTVMTALADRTAELSELPEVEQVFPFENRGEEIGVTLSHPHGQIYGYPFVPPRTRAMLRAARRYADGTGELLGAAVLAAERAAQIRVVSANEHWTAYVPAAARWPFEVHVVPHRHVLDLPGLTDAEVSAFAPVYLDVLRRCDGLFDAPLPYIAAWHQAPVRHPDRDLAYLHLQLTSVRRAAGKLKHLAGSESAMGAFINDVRPEQAAGMLREVVYAA
ncbi:MAG: galactose-1-phosphate uridylyltransferase [Actinobacteria bacterium 13_2_20CM_2_71_6]|nr:MAG: galactose-1-phosphate uridylyltransferase [Actinobacteria bacterium 13_2_20CM_2_71_6]